MERIKHTIDQYAAGDGYTVDIIDTGNNYCEAWIGHEDVGVKSLMFGISADKDTVLALVAKNLPDYINDYHNEYMMED